MNCPETAFSFAKILQVEFLAEVSTVWGGCYWRTGKWKVLSTLANFFLCFKNVILQHIA